MHLFHDMMYLIGKLLLLGIKYSVNERRLFMADIQNRTQTDFIMSQTVDVCFAGLMENPTVRKGFCAAVMRVSPDTIGETELLPTHLHRENANDKLGILDVLVKLKDGMYPCQYSGFYQVPRG